MTELKRADVILMVVLVLLAVLLMFRNFSLTDEIAKMIEIRQADKEPEYLFLSEESTVDLSNGSMVNVIRIEDGGVVMIEANCRDHLCMKKGKITKVGDSIVCLPHRLAITIMGEEEGDIDVLSQ